MRKLYLIALCLLAQQVAAQTNITCTNPIAEQVMLGQYNPATYKQTVVMDQKSIIIAGLTNEISADSLKSYIIKIGTFYNRNTYSDTASNKRGIGAARRWVFNKLQTISAARENRLLTSYLNFNLKTCPDSSIAKISSMNPHRNIFAVLPGTDTTDKSIVLVEGHIDSRCKDLCDTTCMARGIEDNATGSALVIELARVMSKYQFKNTIVFAVVTGEEQGLFGGAAFATYAQNKKLNIKAVLNNDVIGGILCGNTASAPTECVNVPGKIDSTHVRIFSLGGYTSTHKAFARFAKLEYVEELLPTATVPMVINIMVPQDRTGRGGDHIPFNTDGMTAVRFTASHEDGDASNGPTYTDRQHSFRDTLGVNKKASSAGVIDSFFVNFNYLQRNTMINGLAMVMAADGPKMPTFTLSNDTNGITLNVTSTPVYKQYKVSLRRNSANYDLDKIYTFQNTTQFHIPSIKKDSTYYISLASMDSLSTESLFTIEQQAKSKATVGIATLSLPIKDIQFNLPKPNPANNYTTFAVNMGTSSIVNSAYILITDILGRQVSKIPIQLTPGANEMDYNCSNLKAGRYEATLIINGEKVGATQPLFITK